MIFLQAGTGEAFSSFTVVWGVQLFLNESSGNADASS